MRERPGQKQVNWWLREELLADLKEYQHEHRLDSLKDAAAKLLEQGLQTWKQEAGPRR